MTLRERRAAQKREEREARTRLRELERQRKELAKLSAIQQAQLEVELHENQIALLLSIHKERGPQWDWIRLAASLPPPKAARSRLHGIKQQLRELNEVCVMNNHIRPTLDDTEHDEAVSVAQGDVEETQRISSLARRILAGEPKAYVEALSECGPLAELSQLGSSIHFTVHTPLIVEASIDVSGRDSIPNEVKSLTAWGKLSVKAMPHGRFHEIYQDYICGCVLRVARELFVLLPIQTALITAKAESSAGEDQNYQPVLSVALNRSDIAIIDWANADASDTVESFPHHGDAKASRRSGQFTTITPLTIDDLPEAPLLSLNLAELLSHSRSLRSLLTED